MKKAQAIISRNEAGILPGHSVLSKQWPVDQVLALPTKWTATRATT